MTKHLFVSLLLIGLLAAACQRPLIVDNDQPTDDATWDLVDYRSERLIQGLHATPFEWYLISENQFARFDGDNGLLEKRPLSVRSGTLGTPALSDNTFVRLTTDDDGLQFVEFHLARNPAQIVEFPADSLLGPGESFLEVEFLGRRLGAFSSDGTLFALPVSVLPQRKYSILLFEVLHDVQHLQFTSVRVFQRVPLDLSADFANLGNVRYLDGNFYVASKEGAWRITPSGSPEKIFNQHMLDFLSRDGKLYATGINTFDLHESTDNGLTWQRLNVNSELKFVETPGDMVLTHTVLGNRYRMATDDLLQAKAIRHPATAPTDQSVFRGVAFFAGKYYFSMDREVYATPEVVAE